jgi:hypothetical protein
MGLSIIISSLWGKSVRRYSLWRHKINIPIYTIYPMQYGKKDIMCRTHMAFRETTNFGMVVTKEVGFLLSLCGQIGSVG